MFFPQIKYINGRPTYDMYDTYIHTYIHSLETKNQNRTNQVVIKLGIKKEERKTLEPLPKTRTFVFLFSFLDRFPL